MTHDRATDVGGDERHLPPNTSLGQYLTVPEAATLLKCSHQTIDRLIKIGRLPALDIGTGRERSYRVKIEDIERCLSVPPRLTNAKRPRRQRIVIPQLA